MPPEFTICIITQSHLCRNPRALKEAIALANAGYKVQILTNVLSAELHQQDLAAIQSYPNIHLQTVSDLSKSNFNSFFDRLVNRSARLLKRYFKFETALSLGYGAPRYYNKAKAIKADLYICHQELATYIGTKLIKNGFKVAFDIEDWYSEDLLPVDRTERPVGLLRQTESAALNTGAYCITTSDALAKKLAHVYDCPLPQTIYNVFPAVGIDLSRSKNFSNPLKLFWFSQTIGAGRGLEQFISLSAALKKKVEIHLLGNITASYRGLLKSMLPVQHQLFFHELVDESELAAKIAGFDIGLALELDSPMSRNYTITNKFFQYIQSGLPIIASETAGQTEAFKQFKLGFMLPQHPSATDVENLDQWLNNPAMLQTAREKAIKMAAVFNWETESEKLLKLVKRALEK